MAIVKDWRFRSPSSTCYSSGRPFEDEEKIHTALFLNSAEEIIRRDYQLEAWKAAMALWKASPEDAPFSHWQSTYRARRKSFHDGQSGPIQRALAALSEPHDEEQPEESAPPDNAETPSHLLPHGIPITDGVRILLCLYLERSKAIKLRESFPQYKVYEHRKTGEVWIVNEVSPTTEEIGHFHAILREDEESTSDD